VAATAGSCNPLSQHTINCQQSSCLCRCPCVFKCDLRPCLCPLMGQLSYYSHSAPAQHPTHCCYLLTLWCAQVERIALLAAVWQGGQHVDDAAIHQQHLPAMLQAVGDVRDTAAPCTRLCLASHSHCFTAQVLHTVSHPRDQIASHAQTHLSPLRMPVALWFAADSILPLPLPPPPCAQVQQDSCAQLGTYEDLSQPGLFQHSQAPSGPAVRGPAGPVAAA
jgi:hypothetical protein